MNDKPPKPVIGKTISFWLDDDENQKLERFVNDHQQCHRGAIGGAITYEFTPTSIGVVTKIKCACGKEENITNYDNW